MRSMSATPSNTRRRSIINSARNRLYSIGQVNINPSSEVYTSKSPQGSFGEIVLVEQRQSSVSSFSKNLLPEEMRLLDLIELGFSSPGNITLLKISQPPVQANYPFNIHERHTPFIPGDAVGLKLTQNSFKICFARVEDLKAMHALQRKNERYSVRTKDKRIIGEIKYHDIGRITCSSHATDARLFIVKISGVIGLSVHICFSEKILCSTFLKILISHCRGRADLFDDVGILSFVRNSISLEPSQRRSSSSYHNSRRRSSSQIHNGTNIFINENDEQGEKENLNY